MRIKNECGVVEDVLDVIKRLQDICKKQRKEIKILKEQVSSGRASPPPKFDNVFSNFNNIFKG